jgi:hypothetical protein
MPFYQAPGFLLLTRTPPVPFSQRFANISNWLNNIDIPTVDIQVGLSHQGVVCTVISGLDSFNVDLVLAKGMIGLNLPGSQWFFNGETMQIVGFGNWGVEVRDLLMRKYGSQSWEGATGIPGQCFVLRSPDSW